MSAASLQRASLALTTTLVTCACPALAGKSDDPAPDAQQTPACCAKPGRAAAILAAKAAAIVRLTT